MKIKFLGLIAFAGVAMTACVDDKYDLSDVDTTTRVMVNDLVVPVNIDNIYLSDIIKLDENSKLEVVTIDGDKYYAFRSTGTFSSKSIYVEAVEADAPELTPSNEMLKRSGASSDVATKATPSENAFSYDLVEMGNDFTYHAADIDNAIVKLVSAQVKPMDFTITIKTSNVDAADIKSVTISDVNIQMPKGLTATTTTGTYSPSTGIWNIKELTFTGNTTTLKLTANAINFEANGSDITNHELFLDSEFRVKDGVIIIEPKDAVTLPEELAFNAQYVLTDLEVTTFTGEINYYLENMDIADVDLSNIPNFMRGDEVDLVLLNPMIYVQSNNPVADNKLNIASDLTLTAYRDGASPIVFTPDNGGFSFGYNNGVTGPYNDVLSPEKPSQEFIPEQFRTNLNWFEFSTLGSLLAPNENSAVKGIPTKIGVDLPNAQIPLQPVTDFAVGRNISGVDGNYELFAPIRMAEGSEIVYTDTKENWDVEFLQDLTVTALKLTADIDNNSPVDIQVTFLPLNSKGEQIDGVSFTSNLVKAHEQQTNVVFTLSGEINDLDGVIIEARVYGDESGQALSPEQDLVMTNIRARVTGYYDKKL